MVVYTSTGGPYNYAGELTRAACPAIGTMRYRRFLTPVAARKGCIIAFLVGGNRSSYLPTTLNTEADAISSPDQRYLAESVQDGWDVFCVQVPVARGSAQQLPTSGAAFIRFTGGLGKQDIGLHSIVSNSLGSFGGNYTLTTIFAGTATYDEIQKIAVAGSDPTGGYYKIQNIVAQNTATLAHSATYEQIQAAILGLETHHGGEILVSDGVNQTGSVVDNQTIDGAFWPDEFANNPPLYGPRYYGNGMLIGDPWGDFTLPEDYTGTVHPMRDPSRITSFMGAVQFVQHWKRNYSAQYAGQRVRGFGNSWGATTLWWVAYGPDRSAYHFPDAAAGTQDAIPTRDADTLESVFDSMITTVGQPDLQSMSSGFYLSGVPARSASGGDFDLTIQAATISAGPVFGSTSPTKTALECLAPLSCAHFGGTTADAALYAANKLIKHHATYAVGSWTSDKISPYTIANVTGSLSDPHHPWFGAMLKLLMGANVRHVNVIDPDNPTTIERQSAINAAAMKALDIYPTILVDGTPLVADRLEFDI